MWGTSFISLCCENALTKYQYAYPLTSVGSSGLVMLLIDQNHLIITLALALCHTTFLL